MEVLLNIIGMIATAIIVILIIAFAALVFGGIYLHIKRESKNIDIAAQKYSIDEPNNKEKNKK